MGGVAKTVKKVVNNPIVNPMGYIAHKGLSAVTKPLLGKEVSPFTGYKLGALGGAGIYGAGALGLAGGAGAGAAGAGTAGVAGAAPSVSTVAKMGGMSGLQKLAMVGGAGLLLSGLTNRQPEVDDVVNSGDEERANQLINELAAEQEAKRSTYLAETRKTIAARRAENVAKLQGRLGEQSRLELPKTLESLNARGLFNSESAVAQALAEQQSRNTLQVQEFEAAQQAADAALEDQIAGDIIEGRLGLEQEALKRRFGLADVAAQSRLAQSLAKRKAAADRDQALVQTGSQILGYSLLPRLLGV